MRRPVPMTQDELVSLLRYLAEEIKAGDSWEGSLEYLMPAPDDDAPEGTYAMVSAAYRVGNLRGQGGMEVIGEFVVEGGAA